MPKASSKSARWGLGCLALFALPFAAVGVGMAWWAASTMARHDAMQSWVEVPAVIKQAEFKTIRRPGRPRERTTSFQTSAVYEYEFDGRRFVGERVSLHGGSDNLGSFQFNAHRELKRHLDQKKPFRCFVNPQHPSEAVLYRHLRWEMAAIQTTFATLFGCVGFGMLTGALISMRRLPRIRQAEVPADTPWMARPDWATGQIRSSGGAAVAVPILAVLVLWWMIASWPLVAKLPDIFQEATSAWVGTTLAFPLVGGLLLLALIYQFIRGRKFGESVLQLATTPGVVGGQLAGVVRIPTMVRAIEGFRLKLSCIEHIRTGEGKNARIIEEPLWQDEWLVTEPMRDRAGGAIAVPVLFAIPYECEETSRPTSERNIEWRLEASAEMRGVDYKARFEVPVFKTAESRADFQLDEPLAAQFAASPPRHLLLREAGILKEPLPGGGVRLVFPAARNLAVALSTTAFMIVWSGAIWLMVHFGAFILFPILFGLIDIVIIWVAADLWLYRSVVEARSDGLILQGGPVGIGRKRSFAADEVKQIMTSPAVSIGAKAWNNIVVALRSGKERTIARTIEGQLAQQAVIDELNAALRRTETGT